MGQDHVAEHDEEVREDWLEACRIVLESAPSLCVRLGAFLEHQLAAGEPMMDPEAFGDTLPDEDRKLGVELFEALAPVLEKRRGKFRAELVAQDAARERT